MINKCLIYSALILIWNSADAQSLNPLSRLDSLFIETDPSSQLYIDYKVNKNQTLYNISRSFHVELDSLKSRNKELQMNALREDCLIKIPIDKTMILSDHNKLQDSCIRLYYKIKPGESLYHIGQRKFGIHLEKLMQLNKFKNSDVRGGMILLLGYYPITKTYHLPEIIESKNAVVETNNKEVAPMNWTNDSRGVAICEYNQLSSDRLFALHNTAAMDSQIEIENPILNRKIYAQVIGRIPPIYEHDVQIIVSPEAARLLGAIDKRFFVRLRYR